MQTALCMFEFENRVVHLLFEVLSKVCPFLAKINCSYCEQMVVESELSVSILEEIHIHVPHPPSPHIFFIPETSYENRTSKVGK